MAEDITAEAITWIRQQAAWGNTTAWVERADAVCTAYEAQAQALAEAQAQAAEMESYKAHSETLFGVIQELFGLEAIGDDPTDVFCLAEDRLRLASRLTPALEEIAHHPHIAYDHPSNGSGQYGIGVADGHRCAAGVAQRALAEAHAAGLPKETA